MSGVRGRVLLLARELLVVGVVHNKLRTLHWYLRIYFDYYIQRVLRSKTVMM